METSIIVTGFSQFRTWVIDIGHGLPISANKNCSTIIKLRGDFNINFEQKVFALSFGIGKLKIAT